MGTANGMVRAARGLLGKHEQPMGSNFVPGITDWYNTLFHIGTVKFAWCDASVSEEAHKSGNADAVCGGGGFAFVPAHAQWFKARGRFHSGTHGMRPGDVVFYNWSGHKGTTNCDHVGVAEKDLENGTYYVLEGNHNDRFERVHRDATYISGYGRPAYAATPQEDDMQLSDKVPTAGWVRRRWPDDKNLTEGMTVGEVIESSYGNARVAKEGVERLEAKLDALTKAVADLKGGA